MSSWYEHKHYPSFTLVHRQLQGGHTANDLRNFRHRYACLISETTGGISVKLGAGNALWNCRMNCNTFRLLLVSTLQIFLQGPHVVNRVGIWRYTFRYSPRNTEYKWRQRTKGFFNSLQHGSTLPHLCLQWVATAVSKAYKITKNTFTVYVYSHSPRIFSARCPVFVLIPVISNLIT
jgi:hypothetical protein